MMGMVDLRGEQQDSVDQSVLQGYLQQLVGQPFLQFRFSYGDELCAHFGEPREYTSPRLKHRVKGSYIIGTRASNWHLRASSPPTVVVVAEQFESAEFVQQGARIVFTQAVVMGGSGQGASRFGLSLLLSDGSTLLIAPEPVQKPDAQDEEVADWEVFTPYGRYLRVGPGLKWSYLASGESDS